MYKKRKAKQPLAFLLALGLAALQPSATVSAAMPSTPPGVNSASTAQADTPEDKSSGFIFQWNSELPRTETVYTAGGGEILWTPSLTDGTVTSGKLILRNATIENPSGMGLWMCVPLEITLEGTNKIISASTGIYLSDSAGSIADPMNLTITGSGTLEINSQDNGITLPKDLTIDGCKTSILFGSVSAGKDGILTTAGGSVRILNNSDVTLESNNPDTGGSNGAVRIQSSGDIIVEKSRVTAKNNNSSAMRTPAGTIRFISSDIYVSGNTNSSFADGTLSYGNLLIDGGRLYAENKGSDMEIPLTPREDELARVSNGALIFCASSNSQYIPPFAGDGVLYTGCVYSETEKDVSSAKAAYILGDVTWNENILVPALSEINVGSPDKSSLTIPAGVTAQIPAGCSLDNFYNTSLNATGTIIINGTLNIANGGKLTNYYNRSNGTGSTIINNGTLTVMGGGTLQNRSSLKNDGTLHIASGGKLLNLYYGPDSSIVNSGGLSISSSAVLQNQSTLNNTGIIHVDPQGEFSTIMLTGYNGTLINSGTINGFEIQMHDSEYQNVSMGNASIKYGQKLTLGAKVASNNTQDRILQIHEDSTLTIDSGGIVDARTYVTWDTLSQYLQLTGNLIVNGELWLPDNIAGSDQDVISTILEKTDGTGIVKMGDTVHHIVTVNLNTGSADALQKQFVANDGTAALPEAPTRDGYRFVGWYIDSGDGSSAEFNPEAPITESITVTAKWFGINEWTSALTIEDWTYGDTSKTPAATPKYGEDTVSFTYSDSAEGEYTETIPENAGTWYIKASVAETEDYAGLISQPVAFTIVPRAYTEDGDWIISEITSPEDAENISITWNDSTLAEGTDYEISSSREGDFVHVTITFKGNYSGETTITYEDHIHAYDSEWKSDDSQHWHECACGDKIDTQEHVFEWNTTIEPTETTVGKKLGSCSVCSHTITEELPALGHSYGDDWIYDATNHWHECACGDKTGTEPHSFDWTVIEEATEEKDGVKQGTCSVCSYVKTEAIPSPGHTHSYGAEWVTDDGSHWHECACGDKIDIQEHDFVWNTTIEPTETAVGEKQGTCSVCSWVRTETIPALEHTHSYSTEWSADIDSHWHECACGDKADSEAHSFQEIIDLEPTADTTGLKHEECSICHYKKEAVVIPATGTPGGDAEFRLDILPGFQEIPESLAAAGYDTEEKITSALLDVLVSNAGYTSENSAVYDVKLQISFDGGKSWEDATVDNFPAEGLELTLPYPAGTNGEEYDFAVTHMFAYDMNGYKVGDIETPEAEKAEDGICFRIMGLSPIGIAWKPIGSTGHTHQYSESWVSDAKEHWHECNICGARSETGTHDFQWIIDKAPTGTETGLRHEECTICGFRKAAVEIPAATPEPPSPTDEPVPTDTPAAGTPTPSDAPATDVPAPSDTPATDVPAPSDTPATGTPAPSDAPATDVPAPSDAPATDIPAPSDAPATDVPAPSDTPATDVPAPSNAPATDVPASPDVPATGTPAPSDAPAADVPAPSGPPAAAPETSSPRTGENYSVKFMLIIFLLIGAGTAAAVCRHKNKEQ